MEPVLECADWDALLRVGRERHFSAGETIFDQGGPSLVVAAIIRGVVKIHHTSLNGRTSLLALRGPGELVGEMGAIEQRARSAEASALIDTELVLIPSDAFVSFLEDHGRAAVRVARMALGRLFEADQSRIEQHTESLEARLSRRLLQLLEQHGVDEGDAISLELPLSQDDLANWVGASRSEVNRALRRLADQGGLRTARRRIAVINPEVLRDSL